jgi:IS5 family transposase
VLYWSREELTPPQEPAPIGEAKAAQKKKDRYRVTNWKEYNQALVQRGSLTIWLADDTLQGWQNSLHHGRRGADFTYTDTAIACMLTLKAVYRLPLRQTEGLTQSVFHLAQIGLPIPDYSTLSRRARRLKVRLPRRRYTEPVHLVVDSSGLKIYGEGEWRVRQHGVTKRRTWRKIHLGINEATGEVLACVLTTRDVDDHNTLSELLKQVDEPIEQVSGDGGYDYNAAYQATLQRGARPVFPPRENAALNQWSNWAARNAVVERVREIGRKAWKQESKYHRRSLAETGIFRLKTLFGDRLSARTIERQSTEARIRCAALNRFTHLGMPKSVKIAA